MDRGVLISIFFASVALCLVRADFEDQAVKGLGDMIKGGVRQVTGADLCDATHIGAGILACPMPGMPESQNYCCEQPVTGKAACCNFIEKNFTAFMIGGGVVLVLLIASCCLCCYCCCCRRSPQAPGVIVLQPQAQAPSAYPNHPHLRLQEEPGVV